LATASRRERITLSYASPEARLRVNGPSVLREAGGDEDSLVESLPGLVETVVAVLEGDDARRTEP
jgi:hypothetical protein